MAKEVCIKDYKMQLHKRSIKTSKLKTLLENQGYEVSVAGEHIYFNCWKCEKNKLYFNIEKNIGDCKVCAEPVFIKDIFKHYNLKMSKYEVGTTGIATIKRRIRKVTNSNLFQAEERYSKTWSLIKDGLPPSFNFIKTKPTRSRNMARYEEFSMPKTLSHIWGKVYSYFFLHMKEIVNTALRGVITSSAAYLAPFFTADALNLEDRGYSTKEIDFLREEDFFIKFNSFLHKRSIPYVSSTKSIQAQGTNYYIEAPTKFYVNKFLIDCHKKNIYLCNEGYYKKHIIIPVISDDGDCVGFQARDLEPGSKKKYKFPRGFNKSNYLYNIEDLKPNRKSVCIFENAFNAMVFKGLATFGKSISSAQVAQLVKKGKGLKQVFIFYDGDAWDGGNNSAVIKAVRALSPYFEVFAIELKNNTKGFPVNKKEFPFEPEILSREHVAGIQEYMLWQRTRGNLNKCEGPFKVSLTLMSTSYGMELKDPRPPLLEIKIFYTLQSLDWADSYSKLCLGNSKIYLSRHPDVLVPYRGYTEINLEKLGDSLPMISGIDVTKLNI